MSVLLRENVEIFRKMEIAFLILHNPPPQKKLLGPMSQSLFYDV